MASSASAKRLAKEVKEMEKTPLTWAKCVPSGDSLYKWKASITGPENTPFENGKFQLELEMPPEYPFKHPNAKFITKVYHPNIKSTGELCERVWKDWSPQMKISDALVLIQTILREPEPDDPLEPEIANQFREHRDAFNKTAKEWTKKYAK